MKINPFSLIGLIVGTVIIIAQTNSHGFGGFLGGIFVTLFISFGIPAIFSNKIFGGGLLIVFFWCAFFVVAFLAIGIWQDWPAISSGDYVAPRDPSQSWADNFLTSIASVPDHIFSFMTSFPHIPGSYGLGFFITITVVGLIIGRKSRR